MTNDQLRQGGSAAASSGGSAAKALTGLELDARRGQRVKTGEVLKGGRTPLQLIEVAEQGVRGVEEALRQAQAIQRPPALACAEGCDWCCHLTVGTSVPEVARIVAYLRQTMSPEELGALRERVVRLDEQRRSLRLDKWVASRVVCALLVDHRCSAYPVRPLTCRGFNSRNASRCERFVKERGRTEVPMYAPQQRLSTFVLDGLRAGLTEAGLNGDLLELTAALRIALEVPDAVERWLAGEPVFAAARFD
jgi:hypothetical protein